MLVPTSKLWLLVAAAAAPFAVAVAVPGLSRLGLIADLLIVAVVVVDILISPRPRSLAARIHVPSVVSLGMAETIRIDLENSGNASGPAQARLALPEHWTALEDSATFELSPRGDAALSFRALPRRRGRYSLGPLHVRYGSTLGLFRRDAVCETPSEVKVYPAVSSIKKYQLLVRQLRVREMGFRPQRMRGQGMEFARLRDYQSGDDPRLIDWKATARRSHMISREYQVERCQNIVLMIDSGRMLTEEIDGLVKIEYVLHAAILLAHVAAEYDDRVGAMVFSDRVERTMLPRKGKAAVPALAEALFDVEPRLVESDYDAAFNQLQLVCRKRALVVLFTNVVDQETSGLVAGYLRGIARRHVALCVAVGDRETRELADSVPATEEEAYAKAGACRLIASRTKTLQDLARRGVMVIDATSGEVPIALVNRYLDLKARQLL